MKKTKIHSCKQRKTKLESKENQGTQEDNNWRKSPISFFTSRLHSYCGEHEWSVFVVVIIAFLFFVGLVIYKNFFAKAGLLFVSFNGKIGIGFYSYDCISKFSTTLVECATLPLVVITLAFSAIGNYKNSKYQKNMLYIVRKSEKAMEEIQKAQVSSSELSSDNKDVDDDIIPDEVAKDLYEDTAAENEKEDNLEKEDK